jgi:hypothetical protein
MTMNPDRRWTPHLWALVVPVVLVALAYTIGLLFLYGPVLLGALVGH